VSSRKATNAIPDICLGGTTIAAGTRASVNLPIAELYTHIPATMPVEVIRGKRPGPTLFVSAAVHGDEINGVEIVRRLLAYPKLNNIKGTLIAVPIVNVQGFLEQSRYLPDRRDLNRCFPGSERGSVAGRLAWMFAQEIVAKADYGIDLHTGAIHRGNMPQIRADVADSRTAELAAAFGAPVTINSSVRDGSLREYAASKGIPMLVYEAGEALRFDETSISVGYKGVLNAMRHIGMLPKSRRKPKASVIANSSSWLRAEQSGIVRPFVGHGENVERGQLLATISDPFGNNEVELKAKFDGIVIGRLNLPLVNEGDAVFHVARFGSVDAVEQVVDQLQAEQEQDTARELNHPPVI
jgi:predicted deacylase